MLLNSLCLTSPIAPLLNIKAHSVSRPIPMKSRPAKLRETLLINFYKQCNASFSFSNSQCGCHFLLKKGKKHEKQICNSTEQFLILKTLTASTCSKVLHHSRDLDGKKMPTSYSVFGQLSYNHHMCSSHSKSTGKSKLHLEVRSSKSAPQLPY